MAKRGKRGKLGCRLVLNAMKPNIRLKGTINSIIDASGREQVRFYQVNLTLISLADNEIVWNGEKKIKKFVTKPMFRF